MLESAIMAGVLLSTGLNVLLCWGIAAHSDSPHDRLWPGSIKRSSKEPSIRNRMRDNRVPARWPGRGSMNVECVMLAGFKTPKMTHAPSATMVMSPETIMSV